MRLFCFFQFLQNEQFIYSPCQIDFHGLFLFPRLYEYIQWMSRDQRIKNGRMLDIYQIRGKWRNDAHILLLYRCIYRPWRYNLSTNAHILVCTEIFRSRRAEDAIFQLKHCPHTCIENFSGFDVNFVHRKNARILP